ncbi:hypothetical protein [Microbulbifer pacificus]|uniref:hypothetical protein n=1 Tax=Microbulbifer pacificus TaxID=407164 RepID=UPI000CF511CE|nr:hypothetical protein [Microbulbifer pacificus]
MSIVDKIKEILRPAPQEPDLVHPVFGEMDAEVCGDEDDFWQANIIFKPLNKEIAVNVLAGAEGPSQSQVEFYKSFESSYINDFNLVAPSLIKEAENWSIKVEDFQSSFLFVSLTIPKLGKRDGKWELSFECLEDANLHMFTAEIENSSVVNVRIDG